VSKTEARRQFTTFTRLPHFVPISCSLVSSLTLSQPCSHSVVLHLPTWSLSPCLQQPPHQSTPTTHIHPDYITNHGRSGQALLGLRRSLAETRRRHHRERSESMHTPTIPTHPPSEQTKLTTAQRSTLAASPPTSARHTTRSRTASALSRSKPKSSRKPLATAPRTELFPPARARPSRRRRERRLLHSMVSICFPLEDCCCANSLSMCSCL
jgi:hypothetical protein